jgi:hypothetical protein
MVCGYSKIESPAAVFSKYKDKLTSTDEDTDGFDREMQQLKSSRESPDKLKNNRTFFYSQKRMKISLLTSLVQQSMSLSSAMEHWLP